MKDVNNQINYVEFYAQHLIAIKIFYQNVFDWEFTDYGPTYTAFSGDGLEGGFDTTDKPITNGALIVLYHSDLDFIKAKVVEFGGVIKVDTFYFPGGERFQFLDPAGNELAVWRKLEE